MWRTCTYCNCTMHVILLNAHCESPGGKKAPSALLCVNWGVGELTFRNTATISRLKTCDNLPYFTSLWSSLMVAKQCCRKKAPVKAKTITARPPPADTSQSQKKIFLWQKTFSKAPFSHRKCSSYSQSETWPFKRYLKSSKLADVSEHLVVVKIPPPHPHWEAFPGPVKKNSLMLK